MDKIDGEERNGWLEFLFFSFPCSLLWMVLCLFFLVLHNNLVMCMNMERDDTLCFPRGWNEMDYYYYYWRH